jgi:hypothetical protein
MKGSMRLYENGVSLTYENNAYPFRLLYDFF